MAEQKVPYVPYDEWLARYERAYGLVRDMLAQLFLAGIPPFRREDDLVDGLALLAERALIREAVIAKGEEKDG